MVKCTSFVDNSHYIFPIFPILPKSSILNFPNFSLADAPFNLLVSRIFYSSTFDNLHLYCDMI